MLWHIDLDNIVFFVRNSDLLGLHIYNKGIFSCDAQNQ